MYMYMYMHMYMYVYTVSFHNFKSQNFKLSVSNPKNKYVAYVSVLSQISNCQGLGRKDKFEILKTDHIWIEWPRLSEKELFFRRHRYGAEWETLDCGKVRSHGWAVSSSGFLFHSRWGISSLASMALQARRPLSRLLQLFSQCP